MHDYHIHTKYCRHATGEISEYVERALNLGLDEIGFSDHYPMFYLPASLPVETYSMTLKELPKYLSDILQIQSFYESKIKIKKGAEFDYVPGKEPILRKEIAKNNFDYVYGSVHLLDDWIVDHPDFIYKFKEYDIDYLYSAYFDRLKKLVKSRLFDIVAHIDVIKKFGYKPTKGYSTILKECLDLIAENKMVLEINTAGIDNVSKETYPNYEFFKELYLRDIQILLGSDAHEPNHIARHFQIVITHLKKVGYSQLVKFDNRRKYFVNLNLDGS